jgi:hypothetical protein
MSEAAPGVTPPDAVFTTATTRFNKMTFDADVNVLTSLWGIRLERPAHTAVPIICFSKADFNI